MFCHTAGDYVVPELVWFARELAERPGDAFPYSWDSAVLAATYRGLCDACQRSGTTSNLTGCLHLLQMWSWEYFPVCRPRIGTAYYPVDNLEDIPGDARPTMGTGGHMRVCGGCKSRITPATPVQLLILMSSLPIG